MNNYLAVQLRMYYFIYKNVHYKLSGPSNTDILVSVSKPIVLSFLCFCCEKGRRKQKKNNLQIRNSRFEILTFWTSKIEKAKTNEQVFR